MLDLHFKSFISQTSEMQKTILSHKQSIFILMSSHSLKKTIIIFIKVFDTRFIFIMCLILHLFYITSI